MPAQAARASRALQAQNRAIMELFEARGFLRVRPRILQPADVFLEKSGEAIRARTFLFTDPDGQRELCLRPDLTVPTCRLHLEQAQAPRAEAKYCYRGPAFRFHGGDDGALGDEFEQLGCEWFAAPDAARADGEVLALALEALRLAGLGTGRVRIGDAGLIRALLESLEMPPRWRRRLLMRFRRPQAFRAALRAMSGVEPEAPSSISPLVDRLAALGKGATQAAARQLVEREIAERGLPLAGGRDVAEVAARLLEKAQDRMTRPLAADALGLIEDFLAITGPAPACAAALAEIAARAGAPMEAAVKAFLKRLEFLPDAEEVEFAAGFGRDFDYYTGFVFQVEASVAGRDLPLAGGGRYDDMMRSLGGPDISACGFGIHSERLLLAAREARP